MGVEGERREVAVVCKICTWHVRMYERTPGLRNTCPPFHD